MTTALAKDSIYPLHDNNKSQYVSAERKGKLIKGKYHIIIKLFHWSITFRILFKFFT